MNKKKFLSSLMLAAVALPVLAAAPAQADKAPVGVVLTDFHGKTGSSVPGIPATCASKGKACQPYAELPAWPTASDTVTAVGGHFHAVFGSNPPVVQKIDLTGSNITYAEATGCGNGTASGTLDVDISVDQAPGVPLPHSNVNKDSATYDIAYQRLGAAAILTATRQTGKAETIVALLVFHAKDTPQNIVIRCATQTGPALKVYFDVAGVVVNTD